MSNAQKGFFRKRLMPALMCAALASCALAGCTSAESEEPAEKNAQEAAAQTAKTERAEMDFSYTDRDLDPSYDKEEVAVIDLIGEEVSARDERVVIDGTNVTISDAGVYMLSGILSNGQVIVDAPADAHVQLVLSNVSLHNESGPAVYVKSAGKCLVTLDKGTKNTLTDGFGYALEEGTAGPCAVLHSECDLSLNGEGTLNVTSVFRHAVYTAGDLAITGGTYEVTSAEDAFHGKSCVKVYDGAFDIESGSNVFASSEKTDCTGFVSIDGGSFELKADKNAIRAATYARVMDGVFEATSFDDTLSCDGKILIAGGELELSSGDDAVQAGSTLTIEGGTVKAPSCFEGFEARKVIVKDGIVDIVSTDDAISASSHAAAAENDALEEQEARRAEAAEAAQDEDEVAEAEAEEKSVVEGEESEAEDETAQDEETSLEDRLEGDAEDADKAKEAAESRNVETGMTEGTAGLGREECVVRIEGGYVALDAGADGIDSNGSVEISGGVVLISASETGENAPLDYDLSAKISGGTVMAAGKKDMAQNFTEGSQPFAFVEVEGSAGESVALVNAEDVVIASYTPLRDYDFVLVSCPQIADGEDINLVVGGRVKGADDYGFASEGAVSGGESVLANASTKAVGGMGGLDADGLGKPAGERGDVQSEKKDS